MYIPPAFAESDPTKLHDFIERHSFGLLVSHETERVIRGLLDSADSGAHDVARLMRETLPSDRLLHGLPFAGNPPPSAEVET